MRWRRLLALRSRIRDLGFLVLIAQHLWAGLSGWLTLGAGIAFAAFVTAAMATAATTHSKAVSTENRLNAYITQTNTTVDSHDARLGSVEAGTFNRVDNGGSTVQLVGNGTLRVGPLSYFSNATNTQFLATLSQCGPQGDAGGRDNNTGGSWASGERGYVNAAIDAINNVRNSLINHGFMHS